MNAATPLLFIAGIALIGACDDGPDPLIGKWESAEKIEGRSNELEIEDDLEGEATVWFFYEGSLYYSEYEVVAEPIGDGEYELELQCQVDCPDFDIDMECVLDGDELECEAEDGWSEYEFEWERR